MYFGACNFASARHVPDMLRHVTKCLADMSVRSPIYQRPGGDADADILADADMSSIYNNLNEITLIGFYRLTVGFDSLELNSAG